MTTTDLHALLLALGGAALGFGAGALFGGGRLVRAYDWTTEWHIAAPLAIVYQVMTTPDEQFQWWPSMQVQRVTQLPNIPNGATIDFRVRQAPRVARLAPPFKITAVTADIMPKQRLRSIVHGNLVGVLETLFAAQPDGSTRVTFHWYVRVHNPLLNGAGYFLEPVFRASHDHVMREGEAGLRLYCAKLHAQQ